MIEIQKDSFSQKNTIGIAKWTFSIILTFALLIIAGACTQEKGIGGIQNDKEITETNESNNQKTLPDSNGNILENNSPQLLKVKTSYFEYPYTKPGYENIKTYYYGLYINLPKDTSGVAQEIMSFLKNKAKDVEDNEAIHLWIFSDSTIIPKSFSGEWSTTKVSKKCFAHAIKGTNGNYSYDYDIFNEFER